MMRLPHLLGALLLVAPCASAAPSVVPYVGYLTDAEGAPYEGSVDVRTAIYGCATEAEGCAPLWEGTPREGLLVTSGMLRFELGTAEEPSLVEVLTAANALWLDIELRTEGAEAWTALEPRHGLHAVPFAVSAVDAEKLGGLDAQDYATAAELEAFTTLEAIAAAGYMTETQLADAGYLTSEALQSMAFITQVELDALLSGYATTSDIAEMVTTQALSVALDDFKATELETWLTSALAAVEDAGYAKTSALADMVTTQALSVALDDFKATELETWLASSVAEVEAAGYALESDLPTQYTDQLAVAAVEAGGFARQSALLKPLALNLEGPDTAVGFLTSDIDVNVPPGASLGTVAIDLSAQASLSYVPPSGGGDDANPKVEWNPTWECNVSVTPPEGSGLQAETLEGWTQVGTLFDVNTRTVRSESRSRRLYFAADEAWRAAGFDLNVACNAYCIPTPGVNSGCVYTTSAQASVTTF